MKRRKLMNTTAFVAALTLLTTCIIGGTFAKYTTSGRYSDTARVAKFGVTVSGEGSAFAKAYETDDEDAASVITKSVLSSDKVVAPGTSGDLTSSAVSGKPEVAVEVSRSAELTMTGWKDSNGKYYCPIVIHAGENDVDGMDYESLSAFKEAVEEAIASDVRNYDPGTDLSGTDEDTMDITWSWAFTGNDDVKDTYLGDQAALGNFSTISLKVATTVNQID